MSVSALLNELNAKGLYLYLRGDKLVVGGGESALNPALLEKLREHKHLLVELIGRGNYRGPEFTVPVPENLIPESCDHITPQMLSLIDLEQGEIDRIVERVPGGASNVQDIYPLAPLQEGILFHHLMGEEGDAYVLSTVMAFDTRERLDRFLVALQAVIDRHDILRTGVMWEGLSEPVQVVWRRARLPIEEVTLAAGDAVKQLRERFDPRRYRLDVREAPLQRVFVALDQAQNRWLLMWLSHHLTTDHTALEVIFAEAWAHVLGEQVRLGKPTPFRNFIAQTRRGLSAQEHEQFFTEMLGEVEEPTAPYGLLDVRGDGGRISEARERVDEEVSKRIRAAARAAGVSAASVCHLAWGQVLARLTGREEVVFGTVLFGRLHGGEGVERGVGLYINTLPVRVSVGETGVEQAVRLTHQRLGGLLRHEHASLALAQRCSGVPASAPLFTTLLNYRYTRAPSGVVRGRGEKPQRRAWEGITALYGEERTNYPLTVSVDDLGEGFLLTAQVVEALDPQHICALMQTALGELVKALERAPQTPMWAIDVLPAVERERLLVEWNRTQSPYPSERCIHELFEEQVEKTPEATAVVYEDRSLSYRELNEEANRLAHYLRERGVGPDARVGICVERGLPMVVGLLGILKAGGAYVPLDPSYPVERLSYLLGDSEPVLLLADGAGQEALGKSAGSVPVIDLQADVLQWAKRSSKNLSAAEVGLSSRHLAYVIYTSGSTGQPKGAMNEHRGVVNRLTWMQEQYRLGSEDRILQKTPFGFDVSVWELFWPLLNGGQLIVARAKGHQDPVYLQQVIEEARVTRLHFVPSMLQSFVEQKHALGCDSVKQIVCSGEELAVGLLERCQDRLPHVQVSNLYGPTEAAVDVTYWECRQEEGLSRVPIGKPIANTQIYIVDRHLRPVPVGVEGEIYIGGAGVARGYLNRPQLTAERFVRDPFDTDPQARLYRTGDIGRYRADGNIEFLGRNDHQVKIRGYRIELGEIEGRLTEYERIKEAVVLAREDEPGEKRLVAYYTSRTEGVLDVESLRAHLQKRLPEYMVPAAYVRLEQMPLTPNGKLDRKGLPAPGGDAYAHRAYEAPQGEMETALAQIWQELLGVEQVGRHDNFFELGGHSLLAVTLIGRMRQRGFSTDVRALFAAPTLHQLAEQITHEDSVPVPENLIPESCDHITPQMLSLIDLEQGEIDRIVERVPGGASNVQDIYPLAPLQEGILFHHLMGEEGDAYVLSTVMAFDTRERLDRFLVALQAVIDRHDILRTGVMWEGLSEPVQVVWRRARLPIEEVTLAAGDAVKQLRERFDPRRYRLDVREAPLQRVFVALDQAQNRWLLMWLSHHLTTDHTALEVIFAEAWAHVLGEQVRLGKPTPFRNFIAQTRRGLSAQEHEQFFTEMLGEVEEPTAPYGLLDVRGDGGRISEARERVDEEVSKRIRAAARAAGVSAASVCHLAWGQVLARLTGREEVVFGTVLFGRLHGGEGVERGVGLYINTLPVRVSVGETGVEQAVRLTHQRLGGLLRHEHASLALAQRCSGVPASAPLFTTLLNYRYTRAPSGVVRGRGEKPQRRAWEGITALYGEERTNYPLTVSVDDLGEGFLLTAQVVEALDPQHICALMQTALGELVKALERAPQTPMWAIDVLPAVERERLLVEWNRTQSPYPSERCIHELFEEQVEKTPEATAVVYEDRSLSYRELNEEANRLAHYLRERGVGPDARVGICVERGLPMVVGLLGILKAGGAYVPLDPSYPVERLSYLLGDSEPVLLLADGAGQEALGKSAGSVPVIDLQADVLQWAKRSSKNLSAAEVGLSSRHLAYVIYTSGSTGQPKGVMVEHANVTRLFAATEQWFHFDDRDVWTLFHSFAFDFSVWEIWGALLHGGRLVVVSEVTARSPEAFYQLICQEGVTVLNQTPSAFQQLIPAQAQSQRSHALRRVIFGGEALEVRALKPWYERNTDHATQLVNMYGITETTVHVTYRSLSVEDTERGTGASSIGQRISDLRVYLLDRYRQPVPVGVEGEIYIGGAGVARGYLNRPQLTAERFVRDPFDTDPQARLYRTGDIGRYRADGNIEFLGRNDHQVKIRGYRIELGEIEGRLTEYERIKEAVVLAREDEPGEKRLVAYYTSRTEGVLDVESLRAHLQKRLPEYMVPAAYVRLEQMPLTPNGKLDRKGLPAPGGDAYAHRAYEAPQGEMETALAQIWQELLGVEQVGRHDNFFELGGHSLLAVTLIGRMRQRGFSTDVRALFAAPTLHQLAEQITHEDSVPVPENLIPESCDHITPQMLSLIDLEQGEIDRIVERVPGGASNVQDIYPLAPLQEGILFHHLMGEEGDAYVLSTVMAFDTRERLDRFLVALQAVIDRHDILRTGVMWEGLSEPVQVVWRRARLPIEEVTLAAGDAVKQLRERFDPRRYRLDVREAPLQRVFVALDQAQNRWLLMWLSHHLTTDHTALEVIFAEAWAHVLGEQVRLGKPTPFRNFIAQTRRGLSAQEHEQFFTEMLGEVEEPTAPYGLLDVRGDGGRISEARERVDEEVSKRIRAAARAAGVSAASVCHLAWGQVLARLTGREEVVFGTVLFGRLHGGEGVERGVGLYINTLPVRVSVGETGVEQAVRLTHQRLGGLLRHEHASLALAQRCSGVPASAPLFTTLLNYRYTRAPSGVVRGRGEKPQRRAWEGITALYGEERTNYPLTVSVDDLGEGFLLTAQVVEALDPQHICALMQTALGELVKALERAPQTPMWAIDVLPAVERERLLVEWNRTQSPYPSERCIHELFEEQVEKTPEATAVVYEDRSLSYRELNEEANRLAHYLRERGVGPDARVGICVERGLPMVVGLLGILKAGGAYVPLDPSYPVERLSYLLGDSEPVLLLADGAGQEALGKSAGSVPVIDLQADVLQWAKRSSKNLSAAEVGLSSRHLAYVIYTSGSTGQPKGVAIEHRSTTNLICWARESFSKDELARALFSTSINFDLAVYECFVPLLTGGCIEVVETVLALTDEPIELTLINTVPSAIQTLIDRGVVPASVRSINLAGEALKRDLVEALFARSKADAVCNLYGPSETTTYSTWIRMERETGFDGSIGRPIANTQIYIVDRHLRPVPVGVEGEIYIGGAGVARGYLNRPQLTAERFVRDPFDTDPQARLYRTGDIGRYRADGNIEFLGRNDHQVKIRGYRIELGEIEGRLTEYERIKEAVVLAREDEPGEKRLVAYYTSRTEGVLDVESLRAHLQKRLPEYMVPAAYVRLEQMPLTPNGKLDRKGLPAPGGDAYAHRAYEAPQGEMETALAQIWQELLGVEQVGRHDNFFELGGHSLLAVQLISRVVQRFSSEVSVQKVFQSPTVKALAQAIEQDSAEAALPLQSVSRDQLLPLSFAQQRLWFLAQLEVAASRAYHVPLALRLRGILDRQALRATLDRVVFRHESLRTRFVTVDGTALQQIDAADVGFVLRERDLEAQREDGRQLRGLMEEEAAAAFDLTRGPLIRGQLLRLSEQEHVLLITMHHIVSDGWSMSVLFRELGTLYAAYREGKNDPLTPLSVQYPDYAVWQREWLRGERLQKQSEYWQRTLSGAPQLLRLPTDRERPAVQEYAGEAVGVEFDESLTAGLKELSQRHGTTLFMTVLAGWAALLSRLSGQEEVVIGTPVANRTRVEIEELIGFFVNTLAIRVDVSGSPSTKQLLERVREQVLAAQANQDIPFEQLVETLKPVRSLSHSPVFQVMLAWQNLPEVNRKFADLAVEPLGGASRTAQFDLSLSLRERGGRVVGFVEYATSLFEASTVERYLGYWKKLLEGMVAEEARGVDELEIVPREERERLLVEWNRTQSPYPSERCIHELFEEQVEKTPEATAVVYEDRSLSYRELNEEANRLAHYLRERGVGPDARVGICVERGLPMVVGLLGILKAGGAYVPLDPSYPVERLSYLLGDSEPVLLLADGAGQEALGKSAGSVPVIDLQADVLQWAKRSSKNLSAAEVGLSSRHLAYVIYTSGSTGQPKGVAIEHRSTTNLICWARESFSKDELARALFSTSINFDLAVYECFVPLLTGGCIEVVETVLALTDEPIELTLINTVPSAIQTLIDRGVVPASVRSINLAGEALKRDLVEALFARSKADAVCNLYGPSETTTYSTWIRMERETGFDGSIGRPIANTQIYIVDRHLRPVPVGVEGEIYIGGAGVARGYLNRPQLTAERFVRDPFDTDPQARLYRTGDIGRYRADGNIEFLGRNDHQVKIRGYRIELGEIEGRLTEYERIKEAVVLAREDEPGEKRLVAYYTSRTEGVLDVESLRAHLQKRLPEYMVPAAYVRLEQMPLTPNGKLDRKGLPAPGGDAYAHRAYEAPQGEMETALAQIWQELLGVEQVGRHDNFFELGGHSLLAVQLISRVVQRFSSEVSVQKVFQSPTVKALAQAIEQDSAEAALPLQSVSRDQLLPLSFAQQRLWFLAQLEVAASRAYHVPLALRLRGILDRQALRATLDRVVFRHESLRTRFVTVDGTALQQIDAADVGFVLRERDLEAQREDGRQLRGLMEEEAAAAFDLTRGPLIRGQLLRLSEQEHVLLITMHHIVSDGWSMSVLFRELGTLYAAYREGKNDPLTPLSVQYPDYAVWQREWLRGERLQKQSEYWQRTLSGAPQLLRLPTDRERPAVQEYAGEAVGVEFDESLTAGLKELSQRHGTTLFMTVLAGWAALLSRLSGQEEVVIGTPVANRTRVEIEELIGFFVNTLAIRVDVSGSPSTKQLLERVREQVLAAQANQDIPFEQLVETLKPVRSLSHSPVFQVMLAWQNLPEVNRKFADLAVEPLGGASRTAQFDLSLSLRERGGRVVGFVEYATSLFEASTVERYLGYWKKLLEGMVAEEARGVDELEIVPREERERLLVEWNRTQSPYPSERCIHELFEEQVEKTPEATAVVYEDRSLSYRELNEEANRLAHYLRERGVGPDARVGICVERGLPMVVGLLGILKAGGAYVPLDPSYPVERLSYLLGDSEPVLLLADGAGQEALGKSAGSVPVIDLQADVLQWAKRSSKNLSAAEVGLSSRHLAYVIYTSGSTGQPKGAMNEHRGVVNRLTWMQEQYRLGSEDRILQKTPFGFDVSVWELFWPLLNGGQLIVARAKGHQDPVYLQQVIEEARVTRLHFVPSMLQSFVEQKHALGCDSVKQIVCSGEELAVGLLERCQDRLPHVQVSNLYGPTEAAVDVTYWECRQEEGLSRVPIGKPIANTQIYIVDRHLRPVPVGVEGEIYIGGAGVARGYLNRPQLTAERFVRDPFDTDPQARLYRTGDIGRYRADGNIEFLGRNDHQVKIRGYRIELGEIEGRLTEYERIKEAVVLAREDEPGEKRLVAYYTSRTEGVLDVESLRAHLQKRLPEYMVPAAYVRLEQMPLTPNGKLDRKGLPAPGGDAYAHRAYEAPQGEMETALAQIWQELLGVEQVGRHDNFFELGGHSLLAVTLQDKLVALGSTLPLASIFRQLTLTELATSALKAPKTSVKSKDVTILREGGTATPLFLVHEGQGIVGCLVHLALHLDKRIPVYGLPLIDTDHAESIESVAAHHLKTLRSIQPKGTYRIAGYCLGGLVAYEMANQLLGADESVEFVGLIDTYPPHSFDQVDPRLRDGFEDQIQRVSEALTIAQSTYCVEPLPIPITLFVASQSEEKNSDASHGWPQLLPNEAVNIHRIPGNHNSMVKEPHVRRLADIMSILLRQASVDPKAIELLLVSSRCET